MLHAVIMAGGSGTRFWPASRASRPKQLLQLMGERTMLQATVDRLGTLVSPERILIVTNRSLVSPIATQLPDLPADSILGEPCKRDTAPCIGLAAAMIARLDQNATMAVMPADHVISPVETFQTAIQAAAQFVEAQPQAIVTFGICPSYPAESFGYIERGEPIHADNPTPGRAPQFRVRMFREKPTAEVAQQYLDSGTFYWNSGIFVWKAQAILAALAEFEPEMHARVQNIAAAYQTEQFAGTLEREFTAIEGKSIDYAVMERYEEVTVIEALFEWDDVGSWQSLARMRGRDGHDNTIVGNHVGLDTRGCIVRSDDEHLIVTVGMEDCIVVHTPDATLVARKQDEESIRDIVRILKDEGRDAFL